MDKNKPIKPGTNSYGFVACAAGTMKLGLNGTGKYIREIIVILILYIYFLNNKIKFVWRF